MKSNTQNTKIAAITEKTLIIGIDVGSETHFARAFNWRGYEFSRKPLDMTIEELKTIIWRYFIVYWNNRPCIPFRFRPSIPFPVRSCSGVICN